MLPSMKIDPSIKEMLSLLATSNTISSSTNTVAAVQILLAPFQEMSNLDDFLTFLRKQNNEVSFVVRYEADEKDSIEKDFEDSDSNSFLRRRTLMTVQFNRVGFVGDGFIHFHYATYALFPIFI